MDILTIDYTNGSVIESVVLTSVVYDILNENFAEQNLSLLEFLTLPVGFTSWKIFYEYCVEYGAANIKIYSIKTLKGKISLPANDCIFPSSMIFLHMASLSSTLQDLWKLDLRTAEDNEIADLCHNLTSAYTLINSYIGQYFMSLYQIAHDEDDDDSDFWKQHFMPIDFNRNYALRINGMAGYLYHEVNREKLNRPFKITLLEYASQCRYLSFFLCLLTVSCATQLPKREVNSFHNFMYCLRNSIRSAYVHYVMIEPRDLNEKDPVETRGAQDRTNRINVYFTTENGMPQLARFDLPHKGVPDLHINVETESGDGENNHCRLFIGDWSYDILHPMEQALLFFTPDDSFYKNLEKDETPDILRRIKAERALFSLSGYEIVYAFDLHEATTHNIWNQFDENTQNYLISCYENLKDYLDLQDTDNHSIYELACDELFPYLIPN